MAWRFLLYLRITCNKLLPVCETSRSFAGLYVTINPRQAFAHCAGGDFQCLRLIGKFTLYRSLHSFGVRIHPPPKKPGIIKFYMPSEVGAASWPQN